MNATTETNYKAVLENVRLKVKASLDCPEYISICCLDLLIEAMEEANTALGIVDEDEQTR